MACEKYNTFEHLFKKTSKTIILDFSPRRLGWVYRFWWGFNIISFFACVADALNFFNAICGLLTKRANIKLTKHWPFSGWHSFECPLQEHGTQGENSGPGYKRVYPRAHCCRMNTLVIRSIHCRGRLNVTFSLQVFVIVDVRLESAQLWKKCFKNILYSDRRVPNLPPVLPRDSWVLKEYISSSCESDTQKENVHQIYKMQSKLVNKHYR